MALLSLEGMSLPFAPVSQYPSVSFLTAVFPTIRSMTADDRDTVMSENRIFFTGI